MRKTADMRKNDTMITKEFCRGKTLIFYPKTAEEAEFIQSKIFEMGYHWGYARVAEVGHASTCIAAGMVLKNEKLYTDPNNESLLNGILCTYDQFEKYPTERELMLELFNQLAALSKKVDAIYTEVMPRVMDKPKPRPDANGHNF